MKLRSRWITSMRMNETKLKQMDVNYLWKDLSRYFICHSSNILAISQPFAEDIKGAIESWIASILLLMDAKEGQLHPMASCD